MCYKHNLYINTYIKGKPICPFLYKIVVCFLWNRFRWTANKAFVLLWTVIHSTSVERTIRIYDSVQVRIKIIAIVHTWVPSIQLIIDTSIESETEKWEMRKWKNSFVENDTINLVIKKKLYSSDAHFNCPNKHPEQCLCVWGNKIKHAIDIFAQQSRACKFGAFFLYFSNSIVEHEINWKFRKSDRK